MTLIGSIVVPVTNEGGPLLDLGGPDMSHSWKLPALAAVIAVRTRPWEWATHSPGTRARGVSREQVSRHPVPQRTFLRAVPQGRT